MAEKKVKPVKTVKRAAKGVRTHIRRMKQEAGKDAANNPAVKVRRAPAKKVKE